jgi:hypothetical protein
MLYDCSFPCAIEYLEPKSQSNYLEPGSDALDDCTTDDESPATFEGDDGETAPPPLPWYATPQFLLPDSRQVDMQNFMSNMAKHWVGKILECGSYIGSWVAFPKLYYTSSLCTGTATGELTHESAVEEMSEQCGFPSCTRISFMGEKEKFKIRWLVDNSLAQPDTCLFDDINLIKDGEANCVIHGKKCSLADMCPRPHNLKAGFSCKSWSKANCQYASNRTGMVSDKQELTSVKTFKATAGVIASKCPDTYILENVDSMGSEDEESSNLHLVMQALMDMNDGMYHVCCRRVTSSDYGLPQNRLPPCFLRVRLLFQVLIQLHFSFGCANFHAYFGSTVQLVQHALQGRGSTSLVFE